MIIVGSVETNHTEWEGGEWGRGRGSGSSGFSRDEPLQSKSEEGRCILATVLW